MATTFEDIVAYMEVNCPPLLVEVTPEGRARLLAAIAEVPR
jgi:hypothetical protein